MRPVHVILLCLVATGCQCGPEQALPVKLRLRNASSEPLFVDATDGRMGLHMQRRVGEGWTDFAETPPCECLTCERTCDDSCVCPQASLAPQVLKVPPGGAFEREWAGTVRLDAEAPCASPVEDRPTCLQEEVPSPEERFRLRLCYANAVPGLGPTDGGTPVPGALPRDATVCTEQEFTVADGEVEVSPLPARACGRDAECGVAGAVCLAGVCTQSCPAHDYPAVGGAWQVYIAEPEELGAPGFFTVTSVGGRRLHEGSGTLASVRYANGSMTLQLSRPAPPSGDHKASLTATLPANAAVPLVVGERLTVRVVDASSASNPTHRALVVRDADGVLLLAADPAQGGALLGAMDTSPVSVASLEPTEGCEATPCGKRVYFRTEFRAGSTAVALAPGRHADFVAGGASWRVLNVSNAEQRGPSCPVGRRMPYVLTNRRVAP